MPGTLNQDVSQCTPECIKRIAKALFSIPHDLSSMESMAQAISGLLYDFLKETPDAPPQCALVRLFKTCAPEELSPDLKAIAHPDADPTYRSLTLLGTAGDEPAWNNRRASKRHQLISLQSVEIVENSPMISNLIKMLGLDLHEIVNPNPDLNVAGFYPLSVFYVEDAKSSPIIPDQQNFVIPYGIQSVIGFGGLLNYSDMFAVIMFLKVPVSRETAALFKDLAEATYHRLQPYQESGKIFCDK